MRKELLKRFMKENFNLDYFNVNWKSDYLVELVDMNGSVISMMCFNPEEIWTAINGVKYLNYRVKGNNFIVVK